MKINGYGNQINSLLNPDSRQQEAARDAGKVSPREQKDISGIMDVVKQELDKADNSEREIKLAAIAEQLENGTYEVDTFKLAEAMLSAV